MGRVQVRLPEKLVTMMGSKFQDHRLGARAYDRCESVMEFPDEVRHVEGELKDCLWGEALTVLDYSRYQMCHGRNETPNSSACHPGMAGPSSSSASGSGSLHTSISTIYLQDTQKYSKFDSPFTNWYFEGVILEIGMY